MRRKPGTILPIEFELLTAAANLAARGSLYFHGFLIAHECATAVVRATSSRMAICTVSSAAWKKPACSKAAGKIPWRLPMSVGPAVACIV